jgi:glycosyltransferase involved in cell wall biosynthesis
MGTAGAGVRRVTFVVGTSAGGTGAHVRMLAVGLSERGLDVMIAGPGRMGADAGLDAVPDVRFTAVEFGDRPRPADAKAIWTLRRILRRAPRRTTEATGPDVAHAHGIRAGALAAIALAGTGPRGSRGLHDPHRPRLVVTVHNAPPDGGGVARLIYLALERIVARRADMVLAVSPDLEHRMRAAGARRVAHAVVPAPDNSNKRATPNDRHPPSGNSDKRPAPDANDRPPPDNGNKHVSDNSNKREAPVTETPANGAPDDQRPLVLAVGRLAPQKDFATLIDAAQAWQHRTPKPRLLIAGDGPLKAELEAQAQERNVDAELPGHRDDIPELLNKAAVFVMPSRWEGQPLALQEALRAGAPIVASDVGGIPGIAGDAALLVRPGSHEELGQSVLSVLNNPDLAERLREVARRQAVGLPTTEDAVTCVLDAYASALE